MEEFQYLIPEESSDAIISNVASLRKMEGYLRDIFTTYSYQEVLLPSFEYVDLYHNMDIGIEEERMFQFINHEGKRIALRADFTLPLARLYVTTCENEVQRYSYFGKVYRKEKKHKGRTNEFYQAGIELIGQKGTVGEKECMEIILKSLDCLGLKNVKLVLGSAKFYKRLLELVDDPNMEEIIHLRSFSMMKDLVRNKNIDGSLKELLLIELYQQQSIKDLSFDLCMVPSMKYYTGLMMRGYSPYCAQPIISGGRYDHLMHHFHKNVPAIGLSYDFHHILHALEMEEETND